MIVTPEQKLVYAGMLVLKKLDLDPRDGGVRLGVLEPDNGPIEEVLDALAVEGKIAIDRKTGRYTLTEAGYAYLRALIDEAEHYVEQFDDLEMAPMLREISARNLDPMRVRFLWGWYEGELDDPVLFQQQRGFSEIEPAWQAFAVDDRLYENLALDLEQA